MERNQAIGLALIGVILITWFTFFSPTTPPTPAEAVKKEKKDSLKQAPVANAIVNNADSAKVSAETQAKYGPLAALTDGFSQLIVLENKDMKVWLDSKGGRIKEVELKEYKTWNGRPLKVWHPDSSKIELFLPTSRGPISLNDLYFEAVTRVGNQVTMSATLPNGGMISHVYFIKKEGFLIGYKFNVRGLNNEIKDEYLTLKLEDNLHNVESDKKQSRLNSTVNFFVNDGFDGLKEASEDNQTITLNEPTKWVSLKQRFFTAAVLTDAPFPQVTAYTDGTQPSKSDVKVLGTDIKISATDFKTKGLDLTFFFGPNQFDVLKSVGNDFDKNLYLGWPVINLLNRFITINVFHYLEKFTNNYGIIILLLVILIRIILLPLNFKSFVSMAEMKALKPELDAIKDKYGDDMQGAQQEQMKLYSSVGINPLSGCIPLLLQMPVLLAMFSFFPNSIELRGRSLLWATDLSTFDNVLTLPFTIPAYGDHVSMFVLLMTASTLLLTWFNNQTTTVQGPYMTLSYIMPVVFIFALNGLPAGLNFYYLVSNLASIGQQLAIRRFVNIDKIREKLEANKEKLAKKKKTGFQQRLEDAMRQAEEQRKRNK